MMNSYKFMLVRVLVQIGIVYGTVRDCGMGNRVGIDVCQNNQVLEWVGVSIGLDE